MFWVSSLTSLSLIPTQIPLHLATFQPCTQSEFTNSPYRKSSAFLVLIELGDSLEGYANFLDLNVWTSSSVMETLWNETKKSWNVVIDRRGTLRRLKHVVLVSGLYGGSISSRTQNTAGQVVVFDSPPKIRLVTKDYHTGLLSW